MTASLRKSPATVCHDADRRDRQHIARLDWLRARPALLGRLPDTTGEPTADQWEALDEVLRAMKFRKLYSATIAPNRVRWDIRVCVTELLVAEARP